MHASSTVAIDDALVFPPRRPARSVSRLYFLSPTSLQVGHSFDVTASNSVRHFLQIRARCASQKRAWYGLYFRGSDGSPIHLGIRRLPRLPPLQVLQDFGVFVLT